MHGAWHLTNVRRVIITHHTVLQRKRVNHQRQLRHLLPHVRRLRLQLLDRRAGQQLGVGLGRGELVHIGERFRVGDFLVSDILRLLHGGDVFGRDIDETGEVEAVDARDFPRGNGAIIPPDNLDMYMYIIPYN